MGILMVLYGEHIGGAELEFLELANYLSQKHSVRLISLGGDGALRGMSIDEKINVTVVPYKNKFYKLYFWIKVVFHNARISEKSIVTTAFGGNLVGLTIGLLNGSRTISLQTVSKCMRYKFIDSFLLRHFSLLIAGAEDIKKYLISHKQDEKKIHVIHNWVDLANKSASKDQIFCREKYGFKNELIIGCVGRLHPQKGQTYLIKAFSLIAVDFPDVILVLVGDGECRSDLVKEVSSLGLEKKVFFLGTMLGEDYNHIFSTFDIYVQPSVFEGLPRTLLDAMHKGKPIVATDINGNKEAIEDGVDGLLVPAEDPDSLYLKIKQLLEDESVRKRISREAVKSAKMKFDMKTQLEKIEGLLLNNL